MQHNRLRRPFVRRADGREGGISGRVLITSAFVAVLVVAAVILTGIWGSDDKAKDIVPVDSLPGGEGSSAEPNREAETSQTDAKAGESVAPDIEIDSVKAEAIEVAMQLTRELPGPKSMALLGDVYRNIGNSSEAVECWRKSLELDPNNAAALNGMAWIAMRKAEYEKAVGLWEEAIRIDPNVPGVHGALAGALVCLGKPAEAIKALEQDIRLSPRPAHSLVVMGNQYMLLKEYEKAKVAFEAVIKYDPNNPSAHYGLANAYARTGEAETSKGYMDTFRELKAKEMKTLKKRDKAFDDLKSVCRKVAEGHIAAGAQYMTSGRGARAEQLFLRAAQLDPESTTSRMALASLYLQTSRANEALRLYSELTRVEPERIEHYVNEGNCAAMLGQSSRAEEVFRKMIRLFPAEAAGYRELARFYLNCGTKRSEALSLLRKAVDIDGSVRNFYLLSRAYDMNGDKTGALDAIKRALELEPDNENFKKIQLRLSQQEK